MTEDKYKECDWNNNGNCLAYPAMCAEIDDCEHKQLKRLEQERDELKFENDRYKQLLKGCPTEDENCGLCVIDTQNKELKQENKTLNFKLNQLKANCLYNDLTGIECSAKIVELEQENEELKKQIESQKGLITVGGKQQYQYLQKIDELEQENERLKKQVEEFENKLQLRMASDKESDKFWDEIFSEEDYPFNKENAYKELKDYYFVLEQLPKIYMEITGGTLSKTTYFASSVIEAYNDSLDRYYERIDDLEYNNNKYKSTLEEIRETSERYRNCDGTSCDGMDNILNRINEVLNAES